MCGPPGGWRIGGEERELQISPLRYPGFPVEVGGVGEVHAAFLKKAAHAVVSDDA
jgi:hypothetical protein